MPRRKALLRSGWSIVRASPFARVIRQFTQSESIHVRRTCEHHAAFEVSGQRCGFCRHHSRPALVGYRYGDWRRWGRVMSLHSADSSDQTAFRRIGDAGPRGKHQIAPRSQLAKLNRILPANAMSSRLITDCVTAANTHGCTFRNGPYQSGRSANRLTTVPAVGWPNPH
jgi:hypothetical protein